MVQATLLTDEFRDAAPTWGHLVAQMTDRGVPRAYVDRVLRQLIMAETGLRAAQIMNPDVAPVVVGNGTQHMREHDPWPEGMDFQAGDVVSPAYAGMRESRDIDMFVPGIPDPGRYAERAKAALLSVAGESLGGLGFNKIGRIQQDEHGHTVAAVRTILGGGLDPVDFEIDFKSPASQARLLDVDGFQTAVHTYVPMDVTGFHESELLVPKPEFHLGDMLVLATGPRQFGNTELDGPWQRPKDLFGIYQIITTGRLDANLLTYAMLTNHNVSPDRPPNLAHYEVSGRLGEYVEGRDARAEWKAGVNGFLMREPHLRPYPGFGKLLATPVPFVRGMVEAGEGARSERGAWYRDGERLELPELPEVKHERELRAAATAGLPGTPRDRGSQATSAATRPAAQPVTEPGKQGARVDPRAHGRIQGGPTDGHALG